jgi:hypothetical protein
VTAPAEDVVEEAPAHHGGVVAVPEAPAPTTGMAEKIYWCKTMAASDMLPRQFKGKPANLLYAVEYSEALELPRITILTDIHVIEGKPSASANLISALVRRAGHTLRVEATNESVTASIIRADDPDFTFRSTWTIEDARRAKLMGKDNWEKYPKAMLRARAISDVAREACSEVLHGIIYTPEELGAIVDEAGAPIAAPEPPPAPRPAAPRPAAPVATAAGTVRRQRTFEARPLQVVPEPATAPEPAPEPDTDVVDAEVVHEAPTAPEEAPDNVVQHPAAVMVQEAQLVHLRAALMGAGYHTAIAKADKLSSLLGREVALPKELTADEADRAINALLAEGAAKAHAATITAPGTDFGAHNYTNEEN